MNSRSKFFCVIFSTPISFWTNNFNFNKLNAYFIFFKFSNLTCCVPSVHPSTFFHSSLFSLQWRLLPFFHLVAVCPFLFSPLCGPVSTSSAPFWFIHLLPPIHLQRFYHFPGVFLLNFPPPEIACIFLISPQMSVFCHVTHSPFFLSSD